MDHTEHNSFVEPAREPQAVKLYENYANKTAAQNSALLRFFLCVFVGVAHCILRAAPVL